MRRKLTVVASLSAGAVAMYALDPASGRRRRAMWRGKLIHAMHRSIDGLDVVMRDTMNRAIGVVASMRSRLLRNGAPDDFVLCERVRAKLGRIVSHPHAVHVEATLGRVVLSGPIFKEEAAQLLEALITLRGVKTIVNNFELHDHDKIPLALRGGRPRPGIRPQLLQHSWAPATRSLMGLTGAAGLLFGISRNGLASRLLGLGGGLLLLRSVSNIELKGFFGIGSGRRAIHIHKTLNINAQREEVYEFWLNLDNFKRVLPDVKDIRLVQGNVYQWTISGPAGVKLHWNAEITQLTTNQSIEWRSLPGSIVANEGKIQFTDTGEGVTRIDLDFAYIPPGGTLGETVAKIFGADARSKFDVNLLRIKSLFEVGRVDGQMIDNGQVVDVNPDDLH